MGNCLILPNKIKNIINNFQCIIVLMHDVFLCFVCIKYTFNKTFNEYYYFPVTPTYLENKMCNFENSHDL